MLGQVVAILGGYASVNNVHCIRTCTLQLPIHVCKVELDENCIMYY